MIFRSLLTHQPYTLAFATVISLLATCGSVKAEPLRIMPTILLQVSDDLEIWTDGASIFNSPTSTPVEPGGEHLIYSASMLSLPNTRLFFRLLVTQNSP